MSGGGRERRWEFPTLRGALALDVAKLPLPRSAAAAEPGRRVAADGGAGKAAKVMHLLLWGPK